MRWNRSLAVWMLLGITFLVFSNASFAQIAVGISVRIGPPALPVYAQPLCPGPGYMWTPGYWAWNDDEGYYWVPGTWIVAPVGMLWTPGWWGWGGGLYVWHPGYWGPHVGFYGGINYGFGYTGVGFVGGEWRGGAFYYNRAVTNVSVTHVTNVYTRTVVVDRTTVTNVSYNGGEGGVRAEPTAEERSYEHEHHTAALATQNEHEHVASENRENFARVNEGKPAIAATAKAGDFSSHAAIPARAAGAAYRAPTMSPKDARGPSTTNSRSLASENSGKGGRPAGSGNDGFRPFTPPKSTNNGPPSDASHSQGRSDGFRSFTAPAKNGSGSGGNSNHPGQTESQNENRPQNAAHTANNPHSGSEQRQSAPKAESHKSSPPPPDHHKGRD